MIIDSILENLDAEIARLKAAREILAGYIVMLPANSHSHAPRAKRKMTPEGSARISAAVKRRWELQRASKAS